MCRSEARATTANGTSTPPRAQTNDTRRTETITFWEIMLVCWWMIVIWRLWEAECAHFRFIQFTAIRGHCVRTHLTEQTARCCRIANTFPHFTNASTTAEPYIMACVCGLARRFLAKFGKIRFCRNRAEQHRAIRIHIEFLNWKCIWHAAGDCSEIETIIQLVFVTNGHSHVWNWN